jgi:RNA polymerase sigma-70 factor (ECF subfamily)
VADDSNRGAADRDWLARLFAEFNVPLTRFAIRRVGDAAAADVVSETFLVAWRRRHDIPRDRPGPWLYATAGFVIKHEIRGTQRRLTLHDRVVSEVEATRVVDDDHAGLVADRLLVREALTTLSDRDQELLRLIEWDGLSPSDAAAVLGCTAAALKVRLHRARRRFAASLAQARDDVAGDGLVPFGVSVNDGEAR